MKPKLSIIIPTYNQKSNLLILVNSLLSQNTKNDKYEIIIVDNGSDDGTSQSLFAYENIRYFQIERPKNPYVCRNLGVEQSNAEIVTLFDSRCVPNDNEWINNIIKEVESFPERLIIGPIYPKTTRKSTSKKCEAYEFYRFNYFAANNKSFLVANMSARKMYLKSIVMFDENYRSISDTVWVKNYLDSGGKILFRDRLAIKYDMKSFGQYFKKNVRIGRDIKLYDNYSGESFLTTIFKGIRYIKPPNPIFMYRVLKRESKHGVMPFLYFPVWFFMIIRGLAVLGILNKGD